MNILDQLELLTEEKQKYNLYPLDFDAEDGYSFGVEDVSSEDTLAKISVKNLDGADIDALNSNYKYDDVYVDITLMGDEKHDATRADFMLWVLRKIKNMGYDDKSVQFDGNNYFETPENMSDVTTTDDEVGETDDDVDVSSYWSDDNEDKKDKDKSDSDSTPFQMDQEKDQDEEDEEDEEELKKVKK